MRLYRVHVQSSDGSQGFEYCWTKGEAATRLDEAKQKDYDESEVEVIDFEQTKHGILRLLRIIASHPDNG